MNPALSRQEVESALLATADPTGCSDPYPLISCGAGRLDAYAALRYVLESHGGTLAQDLVIPAGETWDFEAVTLVFAPGKKVVVEGMLLADGTTFEASASGWGGIRQTGGTATIAGESLIDGGGVTVLGGTFTLDGSALSSAGIYASGTATTVYVQRGSLIDQAPGYGVFAENGAFAHIRYEDTLIRLSGSGTVRSRGAGTRVLLADGATGFQNQRGVFADLYGTVDFAGYPGLDPVTVELNATGLQSETAARVRTSIAVHRVLQSATHDVWGLDGSYTHADSTYWGNDVFSSNDLTVFDGDATFVIDPVVTVDPGLAAFGSDALRGDAPSANGGLYPSALGTDTVQGWIEAAEQAMEEGDAEGAVDASEAAIDRAATESETNKAWAAAAHVAVWLQTAPAALRGSAYASAWGRLEATALAARSSRADAPWALRALVVAGLARPDRGAALTGETQAHLAALRRLPERRVPRRQADGLRAGGGRTAAPLTHAAFADLAEIRLAVEAGDGPGARAALASLAGHDRAQAEVGAVGVRAAFPDLDVDGALDSGPARLRPVASSLQSASGPLTVGPNPTTGSVEIRVPLAEPGRVAVTVYDNLGRRVAAVAPQEAGPGTHTVALDLGAVPAGVYLVRVTAEMDSGAPAVETRRVVVAR